jgi:hypothetical protein
MPVRTVGERATVTIGQRGDARAGQGRKIDDRGRLAAGGQCQRVRQHHAPLGVRVDDLDRRAVHGGHDVLWLVCLRADTVLGDRQPGVDGPRVAQFRQRDQRRQRNGAAAHVGVHVQHALVRLQVGAARVEAQPLADQRDGTRHALPLGPRPVPQVEDPGVATGAAAGHGEKGAGPEALQFRLAVEAALQSMAARQRLSQAPESRGIEAVRRQCREPTDQVGSLGDDRGAARVDGLPGHWNDPGQLVGCGGLGLETGQAKGAGPGCGRTGLDALSLEGWRQTGRCQPKSPGFFQAQRLCHRTGQVQQREGRHGAGHDADGHGRVGLVRYAAGEM